MIPDIEPATLSNVSSCRDETIPMTALPSPIYLFHDSGMILLLVIPFALAAAASSSCPAGSSSAPHAFTSTAPSAAVTSSYNAVKHWFAFGDSYTATGFNPSLTQPSMSNPIGNPEYPGSTICGPVPTWVDYTATKYNTSVKLVYNFASIGATINSSLVPVLPWVVPLATQTEFFANAYAAGPWTSEDAIFSIWIGINDIGNSYNESGSRTAFNDQLLDAYFEQTAKLLGFGARRFAFFNVPPFNRSPLLLSRPPSSQSTAKMLIDDYNNKLRQRVTAFAGSTPDIDVWFMDINSLVDSLLDAPQRSGFVDATSFGSAGSVTWCDDFHLAPSVHDLIAASVQSILEKPAMGRNRSSDPTAPCVPDASAAPGYYAAHLVMGPGLYIAVLAVCMFICQ